jgi:hypothetical protein
MTALIFELVSPHAQSAASVSLCGLTSPRGHQFVETNFVIIRVLDTFMIRR